MHDREVVHPILQQIAEMLRCVADQAHRPFALDVLGQDQDADRRVGPVGAGARRGCPRRCSLGGILMSTMTASGRPRATSRWRPGASAAVPAISQPAPRRSRGQALPDQEGVVGDDHSHRCPSSGISSHRERFRPRWRSSRDSCAVQGFDPVARVHVARTHSRVGAAASVVDHTCDDDSVFDGHLDRRPGRVGVFGDVREAFGADKVDGPLDRGRQPLPGSR